MYIGGLLANTVHCILTSARSHGKYILVIVSKVLGKCVDLPHAA